MLQKTRDAFRRVYLFLGFGVALLVYKYVFFLTINHPVINDYYNLIYFLLQKFQQWICSVATIGGGFYSK